MKMKLFLATLIASLATVIAASSAGACWLNGLEEPECPECLID